MDSDVWLTPREILAPLGKFDLDPCTIANHPWQIAPKFYTKEDDGLSCEWTGRVWLNPPFNKASRAWMEKMRCHQNGIALVAARTETKMFFSCVWGGPVWNTRPASAICFLKGRPFFCRADGIAAEANSGAPIVLIAYGDYNAEVLAKCGLGKTIVL